MFASSCNGAVSFLLGSAVKTVSGTPQGDLAQRGDVRVERDGCIDDVHVP